MISCYNAHSYNNEWIIDSGASDHVTSYINNLKVPKLLYSSKHINLPTGSLTKISHIGNITISSGLLLTDVLCVPNFKHNLFLVQKLLKSNNCEVKFLPTYYVIIDNESQPVKVVGQEKHGLYYLVNTNNPMQWLSAQTRKPQSCLATSKCVTVDVWHHRLGHLPMSKLQLIPDLPKVQKKELVCLSCRMDKFSKLPFKIK